MVNRLESQVHFDAAEIHMLERLGVTAPESPMPADRAAEYANNLLEDAVMVQSDPNIDPARKSAAVEKIRGFRAQLIEIVPHEHYALLTHGRQADD